MDCVTLALKTFLETHLEPISYECDHSFEKLNQIFNLMGEKNLLALTVQGLMNQTPLSKKTRFDNKALESKISGALSFLTSQINLSSMLIYHGKNESLKQKLLPKIVKGEIKIANAVSQLRYAKSYIHVQETCDGYILNGEAKWLTGMNHFDQFILGFKHAGKEILALLPFKNVNDNGCLQFSEPLSVMVMQATQTVNVRLTNWFVPDENIIDEQEEGSWSQQMKTNFPILAYFYGIGVGAIEILNEKIPQQDSIATLLSHELNLLRKQITAEDCVDYIKPRVAITNCAWKCLQSAIIASQGYSMNPSSKISRLYREIVQFNALAATPEYIEQQLLVT